MTSLLDVKQLLQTAAEKVREKIRLEVKNRPLSALLDIVTVNSRSILGLSVQFIVGGQLKVRSIRLIELVEAHTSKCLGEVTKKRFNEFQIALYQIISMTKDNVANVSKMVRDIDDNLKSCLDINSQASSAAIASTEDSVDDDRIAQAVMESDEVSDEDRLAILFEGPLLNSNNSTLNEISHEIRDHGFDIKWDISEINCAVHTLQQMIR